MRTSPPVSMAGKSNQTQPSMARNAKPPASTAAQQPGGKSAKKSAPGKPFEKGKDARRGKGPPKGAPNAGRPPNEFKEMMRALASRPAVMQRLKKLLGTSKQVPDDVFLKALKEVADRGYGKAVQPVEHAGPEGGPIPLATPDEIRGEIARELDRLAARAGAGKTAR